MFGPAKEGRYVALRFDNSGVLPVVHVVFAHLLGAGAEVITRCTVGNADHRGGLRRGERGGVAHDHGK
ncbi:hypothetical protein [Saccharopolyspora mangrovi]|uniref:Uncharacterized protein n=1 Tax=Saccharopolyspora mangrovi TaxID=3082379 RepID=A0ABU6AKX5_9PSEU|nr:hypothetical protein [Saccharopolyspora sp. S2-29]MEB3372153.1 hypothetical protein [Saccharopolyspora sp. S2-29]